MSQFTLDPSTAAERLKATSPLDLCDQDGKVLGRFIPIPADRREPRVSEEELRRREQKGGGRTLAAILAELESKK